MASYICRACSFSGEAAWTSILLCPHCGSSKSVGVCITGQELEETKLPLTVLETITVQEAVKQQRQDIRRALMSFLSRNINKAAARMRLRT